MRAVPYALLLAGLAVPVAAQDVAPGSAPGTATGLSGAYADNAFAKILDGRLKAVKVYEDRTTYAFMNIHPIATGDVLVIPKEHVRNLLDISPRVLEHLIVVTQRIAQAQNRAFAPGGILIRQSSGQDADQTVFHFHMHVTPVYHGVPLAHPTYSDPPAPPAELEAVAAKIRTALGPGQIRQGR
jgi:histidine triad (HIT) family protein